MTRIAPPKPASRPDNAGIFARLRLFSEDMFRSQPERLYGAWMARMRTPFGKSVLVNDPDIIREVLETRPQDFPKAALVSRALRPLLGRSIFLTNGDEWAAQRRIIDPAFGAGRLRESFPALRDAIGSAVERLSYGRSEMEFETSHLAADVIFRTLFSLPIDAPQAREVFDAFRSYQRKQPLLSPAALLPAAHRVFQPPGKAEAKIIRGLLGQLISKRAKAIANGSAPADLATEIMMRTDPKSGKRFTNEELIDQVAIFFLAGHETSASALAWALYCLACDQQAQEQAAAEATTLPISPNFADLSRLSFTRNVFREALRLYPPVPMMVRQTARTEVFRGETLPPGSLVILSPWHLHRHTRLWNDPDRFDPWRWQKNAAQTQATCAYAPFSKGQRVCTGAGFAMMEGTLALGLLLRKFRFAPMSPAPVPVAHLTIRSQNGIFLDLQRR